MKRIKNENQIYKEDEIFTNIQYKKNPSKVKRLSYLLEQFSKKL